MKVTEQMLSFGTDAGAAESSDYADVRLFIFITHE